MHFNFLVLAIWLLLGGCFDYFLPSRAFVGIGFATTWIGCHLAWKSVLEKYPLITWQALITMAAAVSLPFVSMLMFIFYRPDMPGYVDGTLKWFAGCSYALLAYCLASLIDRRPPPKRRKRKVLDVSSLLLRLKLLMPAPAKRST